MPRGVWKDRSIAKRSAAARKGAAARGRRMLPTRAELDATRGSEAHKVLAGEAIPALIARLRARALTVEQPGDVSRGTGGRE